MPTNPALQGLGEATPGTAQTPVLSSLLSVLKKETNHLWCQPRWSGCTTSHLQGLQLMLWTEGHTLASEDPDKDPDKLTAVGRRERAGETGQMTSVVLSFWVFLHFLSGWLQAVWASEPRGKQDREGRRNPALWPEDMKRGLGEPEGAGGRSRGSSSFSPPLALLQSHRPPRGCGPGRAVGSSNAQGKAKQNKKHFSCGEAGNQASEFQRI